MYTLNTYSKESSHSVAGHKRVGLVSKVHNGIHGIATSYYAGQGVGERSTGSGKRHV